MLNWIKLFTFEILNKTKKMKKIVLVLALSMGCMFVSDVVATATYKPETSTVTNCDDDKKTSCKKKKRKKKSCCKKESDEANKQNCTKKTSCCKKKTTETTPETTPEATPKN